MKRKQNNHQWINELVYDLSLPAKTRSAVLRTNYRPTGLCYPELFHL
ncbi:hypothetical protein DFP78_1194 [Photobacterium lutimaris]|nr:hypothetical protein DFP78_1194 [Photobacterium lutimaris]